MGRGKTPRPYSYAGGSTVEYAYDDMSRMPWVSDEAGEEVELAEVKEEVDTYYYDDADRLVEIVEHNGKPFTYGYDGEGNRLWRTYSQTPVIKEGLPILEPGVDGKGKGKENAPGQNKDKDNGNGNGKKTGAIDGDTLQVASASLSQIVLAAAEKSNNGKGNEKDSGNSSDNGNGKDKEEDKGNGNDKEYDKYEADVVKTGVPDRQSILDWEIDNAQRLWDEGNSMNIHQRPRPWED